MLMVKWDVCSTVLSITIGSETFLVLFVLFEFSLTTLLSFFPFLRNFLNPLLFLSVLADERDRCFISVSSTTLLVLSVNIFVSSGTGVLACSVDCGLLWSGLLGSGLLGRALLSKIDSVLRKAHVLSMSGDWLLLGDVELLPKCPWLPWLLWLAGWDCVRIRCVSVREILINR